MLEQERIQSILEVLHLYDESKKVLSEHIKSQYEEMIKLLNLPKTARLFSVLPSITH